MKFKELRNKIDDNYIILTADGGCFEEFNCRSERYDDYEVSTIQWSNKRIFVAVYKEKK